MSAVGRIYLRSEADEGWIVAWWDRQPTLFRPVTRQAIRVPAAGGERITHLAVADHVVGAVSENERGSTVRIYGLD